MAGFAFGATAAEMVDGPEVNWNLSVWGKQRALTAGIETLSAAAKERTGGKFNIKIHYGEALSKSRENLDGIQLGAFQMAMFCSAYHPAKNPTIALDDRTCAAIETSTSAIQKRHEGDSEHA